MSAYDSLNPAQKEAVFCTEGPLLVLAGAGSGKTRVLTHRIAYLIEEKQVNPWNIMAITFTNKAAGEMRERVDRQVGFGAESIWVSTFHSTCVRILRRHIENLGYSTNFTIYDSDDQKTLIKQVLKKLDIDPKMYRERTVAGIISNAKDELVSPGEFLLNAGGELRNQKVGLIYEEYQNQLKKNNALDFDDLIMKTVELFLNCPDVLDYYQERFRYIMVDEYQDTNTAQFKLISLLADKYKNLCVVGDDDQSIYKFRGANIGNILNFEEQYPGAKVIKLEQNYRSTQNILDGANAVIKHNKGRKDKSLWTDKGEGDKIRFRQFDQAYEEAEFIIRDIKEHGYSYEDCAVLYRTNAQSRLLEEKCITYDVPYRLVGGVNFYQRKEIKDVLAYLKTIANGVDDIAVSRIVNVPKRGIGQTSVGKATIFASVNGMSLYEALLRAKVIPGMGKAADKIGAFTDLIEGLRKKQQEEGWSVQALIEEILEATGYRKDLEAEGEVEGQSRLENIEELINKAVSYTEESENPTLDEFLEEVALVADVDRMDESESRVTLMTLHSAKGLEFSRVYLSGMDDGLFPGMMSISADNPEELEEERRLCYVGITRAKEALTLTSSRMRMVNGETRYSKVSRFIEELPEELMEIEKLEPRLSGGGINDRMTEGNLPWNRGEKLAGVSSFGLGNNAYASRTAPLSDGALVRPSSQPLPKPAFGKAFTVEKSKGLAYAVGDQVMHMKFGHGIVLDIKDGGKDYEVTVCFDTMGVKKMFASFAKLKKA